MKYCCAYGCSNGGATPGKSFFLFPMDCKLKKEWIQQVSRKNFEPSRTTVLCSDHFTPGSFTYDQALLGRLDLSFSRRRLKPDAVPTIFPHKSENKSVRQSTAIAKRRKIEVSCFSVNSL